MRKLLMLRLSLFAYLLTSHQPHYFVAAHKASLVVRSTQPLSEPLPKRLKSIGFLAENGSTVARLVETTTAGDIMVEVETEDESGITTHQVSLKDSKPRRARNFHVKASLLTLISAFIWSPLVSSPVVQKMIMMEGSSLWWMRLVVSIFYLLEWLFSSTHKYLSNSFSPTQLTEYINQLRQAEPMIVWQIECYHYSHVWRRRGNRSTTSREKIVTHRATHTYPIESWKDVTSLDTLERAVELDNDNSDDVLLSSSSSSPDVVTFLKTSLAMLFVFTNSAVGERYFLAENLFKEQEGRHDFHYDFRRFIRLNGFRPKILVVRTGLSDIALASTFWFWMASCVGLTVPYRIWFSKHCQPAELTVTKEVEG